METEITIFSTKIIVTLFYFSVAWVCMYATMTLNELNIPLEETDQPNLLKFIRGFFTFYTTFKFEKDAVCPYLGECVQKVSVEKLMPNRFGLSVHIIIK